MWVDLKNVWFVDGRRFRRPPGGGPIKIPDKYKGVLPKSAKEVEGPKDYVEDTTPYVNPAHAADLGRTSVEEQNKANEKAKAELEAQKEELARLKKELADTKKNAETPTLKEQISGARKNIGEAK